MEVTDVMRSQSGTIALIPGVMEGAMTGRFEAIGLDAAGRRRSIIGGVQKPDVPVDGRFDRKNHQLGDRGEPGRGGRLRRPRTRKSAWLAVVVAWSLCPSCSSSSQQEPSDSADPGADTAGDQVDGDSDGAVDDLTAADDTAGHDGAIEPDAPATDATPTTPVATESYLPTCQPGCPDAPCLGGTEVQAMETMDGRLFAGLTSWMETEACVWPGTSAQVIVLESESGEWQLTPPVPSPSGSCPDGIAPWEQINHLQVASGLLDGSPVSRLFVATLPNEDHGCTGLTGSVLFLDEEAETWVDTGFGARASEYYGEVAAEIRYLALHGDGSAQCPTEQPCLFAFANPRDASSPFRGPTVWRGTVEPANPDCQGVCWPDQPELDLNGVDAPMAIRTVSAFSFGENGLFIGTAATAGGAPREMLDLLDIDCTDPRANGCLHSVLMRRAPDGTWTTIWHGPPGQQHVDHEIRGINGWAYPDGSISVWFVTLNDGNIYRIDSDGTSAQPAEAEFQLLEASGDDCEGFYGYQIHLHHQDEADTNPALVVASLGCYRGRERDPAGRVYYRFVDRCTNWAEARFENITDGSTNAAKEHAIRWLESSPWDANDLYFGTTDMWMNPGTLAARIYHVEDFLRGHCDE